MQNADRAMETLVALGTEYGLNIIGALLILVAGWIAARVGRRLVQRSLERVQVDRAIVGFAGNLAYVFVLVCAILATLSKFGVQTASLIAVLGAAGFAVGLALQGSLSNFASGVLLLVLRPFKAGDHIEAAGVSGKVEAIHIFNTVMATFDNVKILVPNSQIFGNVIKNFTAYDRRRVELVVGIGYEASIGRAVEVATRVLQEDERVLKDPAPVVNVAALADSSVNLNIRPWAKIEDYWAVHFDMQRKIKEAFDEHGIEIPFPQRVVHMRPAGNG